MSRVLPASLPPDEGFETISRYTREGIPYLFIIGFDLSEILVCRLEDCARQGIYYRFPDLEEFYPENILLTGKTAQIVSEPLSYERYLKGYEIIQDHIRRGNTYLLNYTCRTPVNINLTLDEIFIRAQAPYKLLLKDRFTVFSPEPFITLENGRITTCPMKGTINAGIPDAEAILLADEKEYAEHITVVDLLRNDLGLVSNPVEVTGFRYTETVRTHQGTLIQTSSRIEGRLKEEYRTRYGEILRLLLPAGSVTGAPKKKTVEIIREAENYDRGFYTGVFGCFDGKKLQSAVMIRFIEEENGKFYYKSGGGITIYSDPQKEYQEMKDKIYVPVY